MDYLNELNQQKEEHLRRVMEHMGWYREKAELWYKTKNPMLGGACPEELLLKGRGIKVMQFIQSAEEENLAD